jgi:hypothetical protein
MLAVLGAAKGLCEPAAGVSEDEGEQMSTEDEMLAKHQAALDTYAAELGKLGVVTWRRQPPLLAEVKAGTRHWWNRNRDGAPWVVAFDIRDQWRGEPVTEHLETQIGYDFCVEFDPGDPHWGGPSAEWAPCLPPPGAAR